MLVLDYYNNNNMKLYIKSITEKSELVSNMTYNILVHKQMIFNWLIIFIISSYIINYYNYNYSKTIHNIQISGFFLRFGGSLRLTMPYILESSRWQ